ncbi:MAG: metallophosphoesterase [Candidatus Aminicenantales bacterium]
MPRRFQRLGRPKKAFPFAALPLAAALVLLLSPACLPPPSPLPSPPGSHSQCLFAGVKKVVAIGDLHGAYDAFVEILQGLDIVDGDLHWIAGKTHLVQMGDVVDRGPSARDILDLIRRLESEAEKAGGAVHMLLGNHEEMNILGLSLEAKGNVTPAQFRSFLPEWIRDRKDAEFRAEADTPEKFDALWKDYMEHNPQARNAYTRYFNQNYGRWLAGHPVILKINDVVFVHGGISEAISAQPCEAINSEFANEFDRYFKNEEFPWTRLYQANGPLWYRDLALKDEATLRTEMDRILTNLEARAIVVGHTPRRDALSGRFVTRFGGELWMIDTGIWMNEGGRKAALVIERGKMRMVTEPFRKRRQRNERP